MSERREPTISNLPVDKDEPQRGRAQAAAAPTSRPVPPPASSRPMVVKSPLGPVALLLALVAGGFAGFVYWQLQKTEGALQQTRTALTSAEARVTDLEKRLMLSDDESTQSMTVLQANVKEHAAEIRKLWGVANDRNRKAIVQLEGKVAALEKTAAGMDDKIKAALAEVTGELKVVSELVDAQQAVINSADQAQKSQAQTINSVSKKVDELDSELRRKVAAHEEAIKAIDAFRAQVNRDLIKLKGG